VSMMLRARVEMIDGKLCVLDIKNYGGLKPVLNNHDYGQYCV